MPTSFEQKHLNRLVRLWRTVDAPKGHHHSEGEAITHAPILHPRLLGLYFQLVDWDRFVSAIPVGAYALVPGSGSEACTFVDELSGSPTIKRTKMALDAVLV